MESVHRRDRNAAFRGDAPGFDAQLERAYDALSASLEAGLRGFEQLWTEAAEHTPLSRALVAGGALTGLFTCWGHFDGLGLWLGRFAALPPLTGTDALSAGTRIRLHAGRLSAMRLTEQDSGEGDEQSPVLQHCLRLALDLQNGIPTATRLQAFPVLLECLSLQRKKAEIVELDWLLFKTLDMNGIDPCLRGRCADWLSAAYHVIDDREASNRCQRAAEEIARAHGLTELEFDLLKRPIRDALEDEHYARADTLHERMKALLNPRSIGQLTEYWDVTARLHLGRQQNALALDSFRRAMEAAQASEVPAQRMTVLLTMAAYAHVAADEQAPAAELLRQVAGRSSGRQREIFLCIGKLVAAYFSLKGNTASAVAGVQADESRSLAFPIHEKSALLEEAVNEAARLNIVRFMRPLPRQCAWICARALERGIQVPFILRVISERNFAPDSALNENWPWPVKIYGLRKFTVLKDGETVLSDGKGQAKPNALLRLLLSSGGGPVQVTRIVAALWPDSDATAGRKSFDMALLRLRKMFEPTEIVILADGALQLSTQTVWSDVAAFTAITQQIDAAPAHLPQGPGAGRSPYIEPLFALYRHPFLEGFEEEWSLGARERLKARLLRSIERLAEQAATAGDRNTALMLYERGIEAEPLAESLYRGLMTAYEANGEFADALRVYRRCRDMLSICLSVPPGAATEALMQRIYQRSLR